MNSHATIARALAEAFLNGHPDVDGFVVRGSRLLGKRWRWLRPLARRVLAQTDGCQLARKKTIAKLILADQGFSRAFRKHDVQLINLFDNPAVMRPIAATKFSNVPSICTVGELAQWLGITSGELDWFADLRLLESKTSQERLRHYRYRPLTKAAGKFRLIESPKPRLKQIQRLILNKILCHIPPHPAVHGFVSGRSIKSFATDHIGTDVVLKMDLQDFFPSIVRARVQAIFQSAGYPEAVAEYLAGLCTNSTPRDAWDIDFCQTSVQYVNQVCGMYSRPHLPQGAPTSPNLANLSAYRLDCRLAGLAQSGAIKYTRYADDLAFSGGCDFGSRAKRFHIHASAIVIKEGFTVHHRKTRIMRKGTRQKIAGLIVNSRLNVPRKDFDRLKATLTNCVRFGAESQNRCGAVDFRQHLQGRISFFEFVNPAKGQRLRKLFDQIEW